MYIIIYLVIIFYTLSKLYLSAIDEKEKETMYTYIILRLSGIEIFLGGILLDPEP